MIHSSVRKTARPGLFRWCGLLAWLFLPLAGEAQFIPEYDNTTPNYYSTLTEPFPPNITASAFYNDAVFSVSYDTANNTKTLWLYKSADTLFYTNDVYGYIAINNPDLYAVNVGMDFDLFTNTADYMAGTFVNLGTIHCDSVLDSNEVVIVNGNLYPLANYGVCLVSATNIIDSGTIEVGDNGLISLTGENVDLTHSILNVENVAYTKDVTVSGTTETIYEFPPNSLNFVSTGGVGVDTNADWDPYVDLYTDYALSSLPDDLLLEPSQAYFDVKQPDPNTTIYRSVFVQNLSPNAPYSVYIDPVNGASLPTFDTGAAHVGWAGFYQDPATGLYTTNYLYLTDDYIYGAEANDQVFAGVPENFTFTTSPTPLLDTPTPQGFLNVFVDEILTNRYAYMNGQIVPTTVQTNGTLSNTPGRIQISASKHLNLANAIISGQNYLSVVSTNDFQGSSGATIASPYADITIGNTNGFLSVSNLLASAIPAWTGTVDAWSTRWLDVYTNGTTIVTNGTTTVTNAGTLATNDMRVLLVYSQLQPTLPPVVNTITLYATSNLFISDLLNVQQSYWFNAQSVTLTTNGVGNGASSVDGELNANFPGVLGAAQWPNLLYLTNNGAIRGRSQISFGVPTKFGALVNNSFISDQGTVVNATNFVNAGVITNGAGNFSLQCQTATMTNSAIYAGGTISLGAGSLLASNVLLQCYNLSLYPTNRLFDGGPGNGNLWLVGQTNASSGGLSLLNNPGNGDLLGTTITNICPPPNKTIANVWSGRDFGPANRGFTNNSALGHLVLDVEGVSSQITFRGAGSSNNALYVDCLEFRGALTNGVTGSNNVSDISYDFSKYLAINTNLVIYFAQAYWNGFSIAENIERASTLNVTTVAAARGVGANGSIISNISNNAVVVVPGRLRWVPSYAGYFSSTNLVIDGVTNAVNAALAASRDIDSNGNGGAFGPTYNNQNPALQFFEPQEMNFNITLTNLPVRQRLLSWNTVPYATNVVYVSTNLLNPNWQVFFSSTNGGPAGPYYPVSVADTNTSAAVRFYQVVVQPLSAESWLVNPPQ